MTCSGNNIKIIIIIIIQLMIIEIFVAKTIMALMRSLLPLSFGFVEFDLQKCGISLKFVQTD